jgi:hypothetical protein
LPVVSLRPGSLAFNPRPRRLSTPSDAFQLHPDIRSYGTTLRAETATLSKHFAALAAGFDAALAAIESTARSVEDVLLNDVGARGDGARVSPSEYARADAIDELQRAGRADKVRSIPSRALP